MNLRQLRCVREIVHHGLSLSAASTSLSTPQPGISKQIRALEEELGIEIFVRKGKRLTTLTGPGAAALGVIERILAQENRLRSIGREFLEQDAGTLTVATTHTQARYALPRVVRTFRSCYPQVRLVLRQGTPRQAAEAVRDGHADLAVATEALDSHPDLVALQAYEPERDGSLVAIDAGHLFGTNTTRVAVLEGRQLPQYAVDFIRELAPGLSADRLHQRRSRPARRPSRRAASPHQVHRDHALDGQSRARTLAR